MPPVYCEFADPAALAEALAAAVANDLRSGVRERGWATLVVSGGSTPRRFLQTLALQPLAWGNITVTLADERWVAPSDERSNERLVRETLLRGAAAAATFVPLYRAAATAESALVDIAANVATLSLPFDAVVLGMGLDGHCASLFPGGDRLDEALRPNGAARVLPMRAPAAEEPRITLTLAALTQARALYLHIEGERKKAVLGKALAGEAPFEQAPIARVLDNAATTPEVFYCP
jgi:6-phosphogluconolactonase